MRKLLSDSPEGSFDPKKEALDAAIARQAQLRQSNLDLNNQFSGIAPVLASDEPTEIPNPPEVTEAFMPKEPSVASSLTRMISSTPAPTNTAKPIKSSLPEPIIRSLAASGNEKAQALLKDAYGTDLNDEAIKTAMAARDKEKGLNRLQLAANQVASGIAARSGADVDPNNAYLKAREEAADQPLKDISVRRAGIDQDLKRTVDVDSAESSDPNSEISKAARDFAEQKLKMIVPANTSYKNLQPLMQEMRLLEQFKENQAMRRDLASQRNDDKLDRNKLKQDIEQKKIAERYIDRTRKMEEYKDSSKILSSIDMVRTLAKDAKFYGGQSLAMLGPKIAKGIAGEVGVLTEQDVTRYVQDPSAAGNLRDKLLKLKSGKLSEVSYDNIMRMVDIMEKKAQEKQTEALKKGAVLLSRIEKSYSLEDARELLDPSYIKGEPNRSLTKESSESKIPIKKQYSPSRNKTKLIYADGSEELVDGQQ